MHHFEFRFAIVLLGEPVHKKTMENDTFSIVFFYPLRKQRYIITEGVSDRPKACFRNDDIRGFAEIFYLLTCIDKTRKMGYNKRKTLNPWRNK